MFGIVFAILKVWYKIHFGKFVFQKKLLKSKTDYFLKKQKKTMTNCSQNAMTTFGWYFSAKVRPPIRV